MIHVVWIHAGMPKEYAKLCTLGAPYLGVMPTGRSIEKYKGRFSKRLDFVWA
jgi:hypothetical protein